MVELKNVRKTYDNKTDVVKDLDLIINDGELVVLIGESGCGKTTTMQMINRLVDPTSGTILLNGKDIREIPKTELRKNIGYVIQDIGLFPHWTIEQNIATVPSLCKKSKSEIDQKVRSLMKIIGLPYDQFAKRYPRELSGGQKQRIGVARALANDPELILMDEPFSALDPITRDQLQDELQRLHDELKITILFVTHDIDEAIKLGDKIAVMQNGCIMQLDSPEEILKNPANDFISSFIGENRIWKTPDMLKAGDVIRKDMITITPGRTVSQAIESIRKHGAPVLTVIEPSDGKFVGLLGANRIRSESDLEKKVCDIMKTDVRKLSVDMSLTEAMQLRAEHNILYSPVVDADDTLVGIITNTSIVNVLSQIMPGKEEY